MANGKQRMLQGVIARRNSQAMGHVTDAAVRTGLGLASSIFGVATANPVTATVAIGVGAANLTRAAGSVVSFMDSSNAAKSLTQISKAQQLRQKTGVYRKAVEKIQANKAAAAKSSGDGTVKTHTRRNKSGGSTTVKQHIRRSI